MTTVYYHANCSDGFVAALACKLVNPDWTYEPISYDKTPVWRKENKVFVDFCPTYNQIREMHNGYTITILDHHITRKGDFDRARGEGLIQGNFDINRSGAMLSYNYFQPDVDPLFFQLVEDRDLWKFELEGSKELNAYLRMLPWDFGSYKSILIRLPDCIEIGKHLQKQIDMTVEKICENQEIELIAGVEMPIINSCVYQSEIGNRLLELNPLYPCVAVYYEKDHEARFSLRSRKGFDCSVLAEQMGGGGHANASGFTVARI